MKNFGSVILSCFRFIVYSNLFIAFCVTSYTVKTSILLYGNYGNWHVAAIVFSATLLFYCFYHINKKKLISPDESRMDRDNWINRHKIIYYILIGFSFAVCSLQLPFLALRTWVALIPVALLGIGYTFPVIPTKQGWRRLREIYWLKPLWIALAFSILTTCLPVLFTGPLTSLGTAPVIFMFIRSLLFIFALCIPFDIRDMHFDKQKNIHTLPVITGAKTSAYISITLLLFFISLLCIQFLYFNIELKSLAALFTSAIFTIILLPFAISKRPALFYPVMYDGSLLLQCFIIIAFTQLK